jgi:alcohol dehydrogenase
VGYAGAFRQFLTLPETNLHIVPASVPDEVAVFTEPLAAACEILDQVSIPDGSQVAVLGDGKLGLLIAQVLKTSGYDVHQFGHHASNLQIAHRAGVSTELAGRKFPQAAYDWVVDATGSVDALRQAVAMTRPRGTVILKSTVHGSVRIDTAPIIVNEITLVGSRCGRFEPALSLLSARAVNVADMIADEYPLESGKTALARAGKSGVLKVLLRG